MTKRVKFPWSEQAHKDLRDLYVTQGLSASLTAEHLQKKYDHPISRQSVIGKLHKLNITRGQPTVSKPKPRQSPIKKAAASKSVVTSSITGTGLRRGTPRAGFIPAEPYVAGVRKVTLMMLRSGECHWPVSAHAPHYFCGLPSGDHKYCSAHRAAAKPIDPAKAAAEIEKAAKYAGGDRA